MRVHLASSVRRKAAKSTAWIVCLIVAAMCASAPSASSDVAKCQGGHFRNICWRESGDAAPLVLVGEIDEEATGSRSQLSARTPIGNIVFSCRAARVSPLGGAFLQPSPSTQDGTSVTTIFLHECALTGRLAQRCVAPTELDTNSLLGVWSSRREGEILFTPLHEIGSFFFQLEIKSRRSRHCPAPLLGIHEVDGQQTFLLEDASHAHPTHRLRTVGHSKLELLESPAHFSTNLVLSISDRKPWFLSDET